VRVTPSGFSVLLAAAIVLFVIRHRWEALFLVIARGMHHPSDVAPLPAAVLDAEVAT
jgi:hypothetical protein